jgi:hypothetical protein
VVGVYAPRSYEWFFLLSLQGEVMNDFQLAALLRANSVDPDKNLPFKECIARFERAPLSSQRVWLDKAREYLNDSKNNGG